MGRQNYTIESVREFLLENDTQHECELLSTEYFNSKTKMLFRCNICGENFERSFDALKQVKIYYCCPKCGRKYSGGARYKDTIENVIRYLKENDTEHECTLLSTEYKNSREFLNFKCNVCGNTFKRSFSNVKAASYFCCPKCGQLRGSKMKLYSEDYVRDYIKEHSGYTMIGPYNTGSHPVRCRCSKGHEFDLYFSEYIFNGRGCKKCADLENSGSNHWNWNGGGHQETLDMLRHVIKPWKRECLAKANYVCDISGKNSSNLVVHHASMNFRELVDIASGNTGIPLLNHASEYSEEDRKKLEAEVIRLHNSVEWVVIDKEYHEEFHKIYGKKNNTMQQYLEFKQMKKEQMSKGE